MAPTYYNGLDVHKDSIAIAYTSSGSRLAPTFLRDPLAVPILPLNALSALLDRPLQDLMVH